MEDPEINISFSSPKPESSGSFVMPFGKFKGKSLDSIASTPEGLLYLDWAIGEFDEGDVLSAIELYIANPVIQRDIDLAVSNKESKPVERGWHGDKGWWSK